MTEARGVAAARSPAVRAGSGGRGVVAASAALGRAGVTGGRGVASVAVGTLGGGAGAAAELGRGGVWGAAMPLASVGVGRRGDADATCGLCAPSVGGSRPNTSRHMRW